MYFHAAAPRSEVADIARGALAGLAGTVVISALSAVEARLRGRPAVYEPAAMAGRLGRRVGMRLDDRQRAWAGRLMRWPYGASWGAALGALAPGRGWPVSGLLLGGAVLGFELIVLPLVSATPRIRRWGREQVASDGLNTLAYGLATAGLLVVLKKAGRRQR